MKVQITCSACGADHVYKDHRRGGVAKKLCPACVKYQFRLRDPGPNPVTLSFTCESCGKPQTVQRRDRRGFRRRFCAPCAHERNRRQNRRYNEDERFRKYGITREQYEAQLEAQGGVCAICKGGWGARKPNIDHCHTTGVFRALLCSACNAGIGHFKEDPVRLLSAIRYVKTHNALKVPA